MKRVCLWASLPIFLFWMAAAALADMSYYPMMPGVSSKYKVKVAKDVANDARDINTTLTAVITRLNSQLLEGKRVVPERYDIGGQFASESFVTEDDSGVYYVGTQAAEAVKPQISKNLQYVIKYPANVGTSWKQDSVEFDMLNGDKKLPVQLQATIESKSEMVAVPAGTFANCLKVRMTGSAKGEGQYSHLRFTMEKELWYAPGIGLVQVVQKEERTSTLSDQATGADWKGKFLIIMQLEDFTSANSQASIQQ